jgi:2-desacetyl-2-hydroxyethyl bacteriochlorophyllide A dehydrogenase
MGKYKISVMTAPGEITFREVEKKQPQGRQVLIKVDSCAVCTMEQRVYKGIMKYYPFAGGHEVAGVVEAVGSQEKHIKAGDKVAVRLLTSCGECYYCRSDHENQCEINFIAKTQEGVMGPGGLSEYMLVEGESVYKLADDINLEYASLTEPLACVVHSIRRGQIDLGDDVVVAGCGIMGAFHIKLAKLRGARVIVTEIDDTRLEVAKKMGADVVINSSKEDVVARVKEITDGRGADVVFCTVPISSIAEDCVKMAGKLARIVFYTSFHPDDPIQISPSKVHSGEQMITGSVNPDRSDFMTSSRLLSAKMVDVSDLISDRVPLLEIDRAFKEAIDPHTYRIIVKCS